MYNDKKQIMLPKIWILPIQQQQISSMTGLIINDDVTDTILFIDKVISIRE